MRHSGVLKQLPKIDQRLSQRIMMSPQMQQALQFLQLPIMELSQLIDKELEENPLLELLEEEFVEPIIHRMPSESGQQNTYPESLLQYAPTLREILHQQLNDLCSDTLEFSIGSFIIDNLNESGMLTTSPEEVAILCGEKVETIRKILKLIQTLDPPGVGAMSIQESLLLQLERKGLKGSIAYDIIKNGYEDLLHNRIKKLKDQFHCSTEEIVQIIKKDIATLELHPGLNYGDNIIQGIVPDVIVHFEDEKFRVEVLDEYSHRLHLNNRYMNMFDDSSISLEIKNFIKEKLQSAKWLMRNIAERNSTLQRVVEALIQLNPSYFTDPSGKLKPLTMKQLAEILEVHESTITRIVANKFLSCDRGILSLRSFFTKMYETDRGEHISSKTIQDKIRRLIEEEDPTTPLSDDRLSKLLKQQGISCARRTVAKYRELLKIGSTAQRRGYLSK